MELQIDRKAIDRCRKLAAEIAAPVHAFIERHSTVSVELSVLRLLGVDGVDAQGVPVPNAVIDAIDRQELGSGAALAFGRALVKGGLEPLATGEQIASRTNSTGATADTISIANRAAIDYSVPAVTFTDTITYTVTPNYT